MGEHEFVRYFFESDDYRSVSARICEPDMESAIYKYLLEQHYRQQNFENLDFSRLVACLDIKRSEAIKEILFRGLDLWASYQFRTGERISAGMESYIVRLRWCLEDRLSPGMYVNPVGLDHVELLRQYLNQAFRAEKTAVLWANHFPAVFGDEQRYPDFSIVFLLLLLVKKRCGVLPVTELTEEPLSMLVRCGYEYLLSETDINTSVANDIFTAVMNTAVQNRFYLRADHEEMFSQTIAYYFHHCVHSHFLSLLHAGDSGLCAIVCKQFHIIMAHNLRYGNFDKESSRNVARLALAIPRDEMKEFEPEWSHVLEGAEETMRR